MRVRVRRFRRDDQGGPQSSGLIQRPCHWHPILPIEKALVGYLALSGVIGSNVLSAVGCRPSVWPFMASSWPVFVFTRASCSPRLAATNTASADFPPGYPVGISLGKSANYSCTTSSFTQTPRIQGFDMWCCLTRTLGLFYDVSVRRLATPAPASFPRSLTVSQLPSPSALLRLSRSRNSCRPD